jgi:hypothetical protein
MQPYGPVDHILKQLTLKPDAFVSDGALKEQRGPFIAKIKELSEKLSSGGFDVKIETKTGGDGAEYVHVDGNIDVIKRAITTCTISYNLRHLKPGFTKLIRNKPLK